MLSPYKNTFVLILILLLGSAVARDRKRGHGRGHGLKNKRGHEKMPLVSSTTERIPSEASWQSDEDGGYMSSQDICDSWWCGTGQECRPGTDSLPTCVCKEECTPVQRTGHQQRFLKSPQRPEWGSKIGAEHDQGPVCGTDGIVYPSECELHRSGCLTANPQLQVLGGPEVCNEEEVDYEDGKMDEAEDEGQPGKRPEEMPPPPNQGSGQNPGNHGNRNDPSGKIPGSDNAPEIGPWDEYDEDSVVPDTKQDEDYPPTEDEGVGGEEDDYSSLKKMRKSLKKLRPDPSLASEMNKKQASKQKRGSALCTPSEYKIFKKALLNYNRAHLMPHLDPRRFRKEKEKLVSEMFGHFDQNHDGALDYEELQKIGLEQSLGSSLLRCHPVELLHHQDANGDERLDPAEFEAAFTTTPTDNWRTSYDTDTGGTGQKHSKRAKVIRVKGKVGEMLALKCPLSSSASMEWKRYGRPLQGSAAVLGKAAEIVIGETLTIPILELIHAGNYSCGRSDNEDEDETEFQVIVNSEPTVQVVPRMVLERPGAGVNLECRVSGEPPPSIRWLKNDAPFSPLLVEKGKYTLSGPFLTLNNVGVSDTGAYRCEASNVAGTGVEISSLLVVDEYISLPPDVTTEGTNESLFVILHAGGISMYDPNNCRLHQEILGSDIIPGTQDFVCGSRPCLWGTGVLVPTSYIYVAQPNLNRVLVISLSEVVVVDVIPTIDSPRLLYHVPQTDQVWILGEGAVQVVAEAKKKKKHGSARSVDNQEVGHVRDIFLPMTTPSLSGYLTKDGVRGMYKIELKSGKYLKSVDLSGFNCLPEDAHFSGLYGFVILECREPVLGRPTGTLLLDSVTDAVIAYYPQLQGRSFLSPDNRWLVTLFGIKTKKHKFATDFVINEVTRNGLEHRVTVRSPLNASNLAFFPSQTIQSYDIFATSSTFEASPNREDNLVFIDLSSGMTEFVPGVGRPLSSPNPLLQSSITPQLGVFGHFLVTPGSRSAFVINGRTKTVNCQVGGGPLNNISSILWLQPKSSSI